MAQFPREIDLKINTSWATVRPGDTLVVAVDKKFTEAEADDMKMRLQELLPRVMVVIVPAAQLMVYRPEDEVEKRQRVIREKFAPPQPYQKIYDPGDMNRDNCLPDCPDYYHEH